MAKNLFDGGGLHGDAVARAAGQSLRLMEEFASRSSAHTAEQMLRMSSALSFASSFKDLSQRLAALDHQKVASSSAFMASQSLSQQLAELGKQKVEPSSAFTASLKLASTLGRIEAAASPSLSGLSFARAALPDFTSGLLSRSSEMLRAMGEGSAAVRASSEFARQSSILTALAGIRVNQQRVNSIVEGLAAATISGLEPEEAHGVATAFEEAVTAQATVADSSHPDEQVILEEFSERLLQAVVARLPEQRARESPLSIGTLIQIILALVTLAAMYHIAVNGSESDTRNTEAINSQQDVTNELLRNFLREWVRQSSDSVLKMRSVDRDAYVFKRPAKRAAVVAIVPEGVEVAVVDVWGRWAKVTYIDAVADIRRTGWVLKKYLE